GYAFLQSLVILILNFPALGFIVTLGGVSYQQIFVVIVTLGATWFLTSSLAFFVAILSRNRQTAQGLFVAVMFLYGMAILSFTVISATLRQHASGSTLMLNAAEWCNFAANGMVYFFPATRLYEILTVGYSGGPPLMFIGFCLLAGFGLLALSDRIFETHSDHTEPQKTELKRGWRNSPFLLRPAPQPEKKRKGPTTRRSDRCWENPFVWREFQFQKGGWKSVAASAITSVFVFILLVVLIRINLPNPGPFQNAFGDALFGFCFVWLSLGIPGTILAAAALFATVLSAEIKGKTLGTLFLISRPPREIMRELTRGRLLLLTHAVVPLLLGLGGSALSFFLPSTVWTQKMADPWMTILFIE
ncbi:MAG: hypothetical protein KDA36_13255, partial [Planctomycetaceae bacterium]|nr:hypothetical protein [Planctomycetaceae bacterium]